MVVHSCCPLLTHGFFQVLEREHNKEWLCELEHEKNHVFWTEYRKIQKFLEKNDQTITFQFLYGMEEIFTCL